MTTTPPPRPDPNQQTYGTTWQDQPGEEEAQWHQNWGPGHPPAPPVPPQPEPKKSWFRQHKIMTGLLAILVLIVAVSLIREGDETPTATGRSVATEAAPRESSPGLEAPVGAVALG